MILFNILKLLIIRFLNIEANSLIIIILFIVIYLTNFINLFIIIRIKLKVVFSLVLRDKLVIKFIMISFYKVKRRNNDYNALYN